MTKFHLIKASGAADTTAQIIVGDLPQTLSVAPGNYEIAAAERTDWQTVTVSSIAPTQIAVAREYTTGTGSETLDLDTVGTVTGTATYEVVGGLVTGITLADSVLTVDTDAAADGASVTVRRSDGAGVVDIILTVTLVSLTIVDTDGDYAYEVQYGEDGTSDLVVTINGVDYTLTAADQDTIEAGTVVVKAAAVIGVTTNADGEGDPEPGDVLGTAETWIAFGSSEVAPTHRWEEDIAGTWTAISGATGASFNSAGVDDGTVVRRVDIWGAVEAPTNSITLGTASSGDVIDTFTVSDYTALASYVGESGLGWTFTGRQGGGAAGGNVILIDPGTDRARASGVAAWQFMARGSGAAANQRSVATIRRGSALGEVGVFPAARLSGNNAYFATMHPSGNVLRLRKCVAGVVSQIGSVSADGLGFAAPGETIELGVTCSGSTIALLIDGVTVISVTDTDIAGGQPGLAAIESTTTGIEADTYTGGDI